MWVIKLRTVAREGWLRGWSAGRGLRGAGCSYRPTTLPPASLSFRARVAQFAGIATWLRHTLDSPFDHHHADRTRKGLGDAVLLPLMPCTRFTSRLGNPWSWRYILHIITVVHPAAGQTTRSWFCAWNHLKNLKFVYFQEFVSGKIT